MIKQSSMLILGRGTLAVLKELREGKREFRQSLESAGFNAQALEPFVVLMNNIETAYACPRILKDEYSNDKFLNSLVYPFFTDTFAAGVTPVSDELKNDLNPELTKYSVVNEGNNSLDMMKVALLSADNVLVISDSDNPDPDSGVYPEFKGAINSIGRNNYDGNTGAVLNNYIYDLWQEEYFQKMSLEFDLLNDRNYADMKDASLLAPAVTINTFSDIPEIAERLSKAGINTMILDPCFPAKQVDSQLYSSFSSYGFDLSRIDWAQEADRLGMGTAEAGRIKNILPNERPEGSKDADGLFENQFYAGIELYQMLARDKSSQKKFQAFERHAPWWNEIRDYSRYLAYQRITDQKLSSRATLEYWESHIDDAAKIKYDNYRAVYEYMNYVAYLQLKAAVGTVHKKIEGMKVLMDYTVLAGRDSCDVVFHPEHFKDNAGNLVSPFVNGQVRTETVLNNWHAMESLKFKPFKDNLEFWFKGFGFDGGRLSGMDAYSTVKETGFTPDILLSELADTIRGINHSALIIVEPYTGYTASAHVRRAKNIYATLNVSSENDISPQIVSNEAGNKGRLWVRLTGDISQNQIQNLLVDSLNKMGGSGVDSYVSFRVRSEDIINVSVPGKFNLISFMESLKASIMGPSSYNEARAFADGYSRGCAMPLKESEASALVDNGWQLSKALEYQVSKKGVFSEIYLALNRIGLTEKDAPALWNDIKSMQRRANSYHDTKDVLRANNELCGYIKGYVENAYYKNYVKSTGGHISQDSDILKKLLAEEDTYLLRDGKDSAHLTVEYAENGLGDMRAKLMGLSGALLSTGRYEEVKKILTYLAGLQNADGMIPGMIRQDGSGDYTSSDAPLWFIEVLNRYYCTAHDAAKNEYIREKLPVVNRIMQCYMKEAGAVHMDKNDHLVVVPDYSTQMDTQYGGRLTVPRGGKPVEIQALFYNALCAARDLNNVGGEPSLSNLYDELSLKTGRSINERYFGNGEIYPYDVLDGNASVKHDVRPHALLLISLSENDGLLSDERKDMIVNTVEKQLYTPYGLRSLSPDNENYYGAGEMATAAKEKRYTDYQGAAWPYFLSSYFYAKLSLVRNKSGSAYSSAKEELKRRLNNLLFVAKEGTVPEVYSGNAPYNAGEMSGPSVYSISGLIECMDIVDSDTPVKRYNVANRNNIRLDAIMGIITAG